MNQTSELQAVKQRLGIVGNAPSLNQAIERALRVAPIDLSVLVTGESGSGKEFFPKIIHQNSPRKHGKYIAVNCGAIPEGTIDSELFGHEKGSFTGAVGSRKGYFEEADGGTIFLDEVAELPLTTQARLLRVLENGEFLKVGSSQVQRTNVRIVAATNVDMLAAVAEGKFREDLFYRLSTIEIHVPPLRDRGADIALLARKFAADFAERYRMPAITFSERARDIISHQNWPGNVRQLKNVVEQMALFESGEEITVETLSKYLPETASQFAPARISHASATYEQEREMLFNMIFRLRGEIDDLRAALEGRAPTQHSAEEESSAKRTDVGHHLVKFSPAPDPIASIHHHTVDIDNSQVVDMSTKDNGKDDLDLENLERETIQRALQRNEGRRKAAAAQLNISERTLYRKIKEYGLE